MSVAVVRVWCLFRTEKVPLDEKYMSLHVLLLLRNQAKGIRDLKTRHVMWQRAVEEEVKMKFCNWKFRKCSRLNNYSIS